MRLTLIGLVVLVVGVLIAGACSPLKTFDAVLPKDGTSREIATDVPYGEGPRRTLDIYAPRDMAADKPKPVIFFVYGGSWANGTKDGYAFVGRALAASGFVVVIADYRLVPEVYFPDFLQDCAAAFRWTVANVARYGGDPHRIVLAGHSAGAYNAAMLALDPQWLGADRAAVKGFVGLAGPYDFLPLDGPIPVKTFGQWPRLEETQPIHYVAGSAPPMLLLHGSKDDTVWPKNSINLDRRLREVGARSELKVYEGTGHVGIVTAIARPFRDNAPSLADITAFAHRVAGE